MKAALEAWGASSNLSHQGFAKEADDDEVIAATMEKPGVSTSRAAFFAYSRHDPRKSGHLLPARENPLWGPLSKLDSAGGSSPPQK
jgi:hypothetical protein